MGRVPHQAFVDTYLKHAHYKLCTRHTALTAADLLNDRVLPFYEEQGIRFLWVLTDREIELCGKPAEHDYQLFLTPKDVDHSRNKARHL